MFFLEIFCNILLTKYLLKTADIMYVLQFNILPVLLWLYLGFYGCLQKSLKINKKINVFPISPSRHKLRVDSTCIICYKRLSSYLNYCFSAVVA